MRTREKSSLTLIKSITSLARIVPKPIKRKITDMYLSEIQIYVSEIHVERITRTRHKLFKWLERHPQTMMMLTFSSNEPSPEVIHLYSELIKRFNNPIGLHVHISNVVYSPPLLPSYSTQLKRIRDGLLHLWSLGKTTKDFTSGHWNYNTDTFLVCSELALTNVHVHVKEIPKITSTCGIPKGIKLIPVMGYLHDYNLT